MEKYKVAAQNISRESHKKYTIISSKNERANIDKREEEALKKLSVHLLSLSSEDLVVAQRNDELIEVICDEEVNNS